MTTRGYCYILLLTVLSAAASCVKYSDTRSGEPSVLGVDRSAATVAAKAAGDVTVEVVSDGEWSSESPEWITVSPGRGSEGTTTVTLSFADNVDSDGSVAAARSGEAAFWLGGSRASSALERTVKVNQRGDPLKSQSSVTSVTVAEFLDFADPETWYQVTGVIGTVYDRDKGVLTLGDDSGSLYVDGLGKDALSDAGGALDLYGLKEGYYLTVTGKWRDYYDSPEMYGAWYVSHTSGKTMTVTEACSAESGVRVVVPGTVVALCGQGAVLTDGESCIFAHVDAFDASAYSIGDSVTAEAVTAFVGGNLRMEDVSLTRVSSSGGYSYPQARELSGEDVSSYASAASIAVEYVRLRGRLSVLGGAASVQVNGAGQVSVKLMDPLGSLSPTADDHGKTIDTYGYVVCLDGETAISFVPVSVSLSGSAAVTVEDILGYADGTSVEAVSGLVMAVSKEGFVLSDDGEHNIFVESGADFSAGDFLTVSGASKSTVSRSVRLVGASGMSVEYSGTAAYPEPQVLEGTAFDAAITDETCRYVEYEGTLSVSGGTYAVQVEDASGHGMLMSPVDGQLSVLSGLDGQKVRIRGYHSGTDAASASLVTVVSDIEYAAVYFVTVDGAGRKTGASWENAMGMTELLDVMRQSLDGYTFHLGAGTYPISDSETGMSVTSKHKCSFYGGYSPASTGIDTSMRDVSQWETVLSGSGKYGILNIGDDTDIYFDGITFSDGYTASSAANAQATAVLLGGSNAGSVTVEFNGCTFRDNKNESTSSSVGNGAALWIGAANVRCRSCEFTGNSGRQSVVAFPSSTLSTLYLYNCSIHDNVTTFGGPHYGYVIQNIGTTFICNTTIYNNRGTQGRKGAIQDQCGMVIANSTIVETGNGTGENGTVLRVTSKRGVSFMMNSMLLNSNSSDGWCAVYVTDGGTWQSKGYNLLSACQTAGSSSTYVTDATDVSTSLNATGAVWNAAYGAFTWSGTVSGMSNCTEAWLRSEISKFSPAYNDMASGERFLQWADQYGGLAVDQNGGARNSSSLWPGAYEQH